MIKKAQLGKEIAVSVSNKIGVLADMSKILADHGISILAVAGYSEGKDAKIMLVTADNLRAADALKKNSYKNVKENEVILVELENKTGALKLVAEKLAAESIDIKYIYGTTCVAGCPAMIALLTSDNAKALVAFKK